MEESRILPFSIPSVNNSTETSLLKIKEVMGSKRYVEGKNVKILEEALSQRYKRKVIAVPSGTVGLIIALDSILKDKKEVIVPSLSFSAIIQAIIHAGGKPIFADVLEDTWNLDIQDVERKINENTGAIMPVNLFGVPCDVESFEEISNKYNIPLIYDSCQAFGAQTPNGEIGTFGDIEVFSLDATKVLSSGLGGFITIKDDEVYDRILLAKNFGNDSEKIPRMLGINGRMHEFLAILAHNNFSTLEKTLETIRMNAKGYRKLLSEVPNIKFQKFDANNASPQYFGIFLDHPDPKIGYKLKKALMEKGIETRIYNPSNMHKMSFFTKDDISLKNTEKMCSKIICLPMHGDVKEHHKNIIKETFMEVLK